MDQFKLKSIDEFDKEFVESFSQKKPTEPAPAKKKEALETLLTPEARSMMPKQKTTQSAEDYFSKPTQEGMQNKARPLVPLNSDFSYAPDTSEKSDNRFAGLYDESEIENEAEEKAKKNGGMKALKIISVIMICATVLTFVLGCFVCVFLDNNGLDIGGVTFNTCCQDIETLGVKKGDLIIAKKPSENAYYAQDYIAVPSSTLKGTDIQSVESVSPVSVDEKQITTRSMIDGINQYTYLASQCYGVVSFYIPSMGGLFSFALENAILVSILFVLLVAFWSLILIISGKSKPAKKND